MTSTTKLPMFPLIKQEQSERPDSCPETCIIEDLNDSVLCIIGLGYVGLPLAHAFSSHLITFGYDIDEEKIRSLTADGNIRFFPTSDPRQISEADLILIAVPTPITYEKKPDLTHIITAGRTVGMYLRPGATVVLESTVWPGLTEEILIPILESSSGMHYMKDFFVGYSPERINPGDSDHTLETVTKIVAAGDERTRKRLAGLYGLITSVYEAPDIRTAEAAKLIENIQRDINIALINEFSIIANLMGLDTQAVLKAAETKWNFHQYHPGLVGGHCIPVDPYYLLHRSYELGYHPRIIQAGREVNESIPEIIADKVIQGLDKTGIIPEKSRILILGLTYKTDIPDIRESQVTGIVSSLAHYQAEIYGYDPFLTMEEMQLLGVIPLNYLSGSFDVIIIATAHSAFSKMNFDELLTFCTDFPIIIDVYGLFRDRLSRGFSGVYKTL